MSELQSALSLESLPEGSGTDFQTVGGFVFARLEHIPTPSERVTWQDLTFEVMDMDGQRIDKVLVSLGGQSVTT